MLRVARRAGNIQVDQNMQRDRWILDIKAALGDKYQEEAPERMVNERVVAP